MQFNSIESSLLLWSDVIVWLTLVDLKQLIELSTKWFAIKPKFLEKVNQIKGAYSICSAALRLLMDMLESSEFKNSCTWRVGSGRVELSWVEHLKWRMDGISTWKYHKVPRQYLINWVINSSDYTKDQVLPTPAHPLTYSHVHFCSFNNVIVHILCSLPSCFGGVQLLTLYRNFTNVVHSTSRDKIHARLSRDTNWLSVFSG